MYPFYENKEKSLDVFEAENMEFPEHLHSHIEIPLVLDGRLTVQVMEKRQELTAGDCVVIFPQQIHSYQCPAGSRTRVFIFDNSLTGNYLHSIQKYVPSTPFIASGQLPGDAALALDRLYALAENFSEKNDFSVCSAWIQVLFALVWPQLTTEKRNKSESAELTCRLVQYIMEHFQEPLTLEMLAHELHVSKYYISCIFSNQLKINFRQYLNRIRLEYAMRLMKTTDSTLTTLWAEAGFNSQRSFNRAFGEIVGMTPMEYRKAGTSSKIQDK